MTLATHALEAGYDIRQVQTLLGHGALKTTIIYTHVTNKPAVAVRSPLDAMATIALESLAGHHNRPSPADVVSEATAPAGRPLGERPARDSAQCTVGGSGSFSTLCSLSLAGSGPIFSLFAA
jgi:hypothetical protein